MYQALYRKYRPQTFDDVIGQEHITESLKRQVETGHLSHAYIFIGTRGTGKTTCARILAKAVNCENPVNGNPCCRCPSCLGIADGSVMDIVELDAASNNGVDNVRALREEAVFSPANVKKRVYIIDEVHMLSTAAFNALLKILEEPPEHLMFILATTELQKVPATILSRCQRHSFKRIENGVLSEYLKGIAAKENLNLSSDAASVLAGLAEGSVRDALSMLDQCTAYRDIDTEQVYEAVGLAGNLRTMSLFEKIMAKDAVSAVEELDSLWFDGKDVAGIIGELSSLTRDVLITQMAPKSAKRLTYGGYAEDRIANYASSYDGASLMHVLSELQSALDSMKSGLSPKTRAELSVMNICLGAAAAPVPSAAPAQVGVKPAPAFKAPEVKQTPETKKETEKPAPATAEEDNPFKVPPAPEAPPPSSKVQGDTDIWEKISDTLKPNLPFDLKSGISQVEGAVDGTFLTLTVPSDFLMDRFGKPGITALIEKTATEIYGKTLMLKLIKGEHSRGPETRSLDELKKFEEINWR